MVIRKSFDLDRTQHW